MNCHSISDPNLTILKNMHRLPCDLDLVVGVPRSGLLAANLFSLMADISLSVLDSYAEGRVYTLGITKIIGMRPWGRGRARCSCSKTASTARAMTEARVQAVDNRPPLRRPVLCLETHSLIESSFGTVLTTLPAAVSTGQFTQTLKNATQALLEPDKYAARKRRLQGCRAPAGTQAHAPCKI